MSINTVSVQSSTNSVAVLSNKIVVEPVLQPHTVVVDGQTNTLQVDTTEVTLTLQQTPVAVSVQPTTIDVVTASTQGPEGAQGPAGADATSDEIIMLNKAERRDVVENDPNPGDITIYDGTAAPLTIDGAAGWLITRRIFTKDGALFDSEKKFASSAEDQIWTNRAGLTYT